MGFKINPSSFYQATSALEKSVRKNVQTYGQMLARSYEQTARSGAPWVDRRGNARSHLSASSSGTSRVTVQMGGSAPNYKRGKYSARDYMEYLEFDHEGKYATVLPAANLVAEEALKQFPNAVLHGKPQIKIHHNRAELNRMRRQDKEFRRYQRWLRKRDFFNHR